MPARNRILMVFTQVFADGGIQRFNRTLLTACEQAGMECEAYAFRDATIGATAASTRVTAFAGRKTWFALSTFGAVLFGRYDIVFVGHVNFLTVVALALRLRPRRAPHSLLIAHGVDVWTGISGARRWLLKSMTKILCVSHYTSSMVQRQAPEIPADRYVIFPNALNLSGAPASVRSFEGPLAQRLSGQRFILSVARISHYDRAKGICSVMEALPMLEDPDIRYCIAGNGDDRAFLETVAERLGVSHRVIFLGSVTDEELVELYQRCEAFVLPSGQEGFGIVFLEAMYFGAPVIAAREKGAVDVVENEVTGLLVPYGDIVALKSALDRLLASPDLRDLLRVNGRATVTDGGPFTFQAFARRWRAIC